MFLINLKGMKLGEFCHTCYVNTTIGYFGTIYQKKKLVYSETLTMETNVANP